MAEYKAENMYGFSLDVEQAKTFTASHPATILYMDDEGKFHLVHCQQYTIVHDFRVMTPEKKISEKEENEKQEKKEEENGGECGVIMRPHRVYVVNDERNVDREELDDDDDDDDDEDDVVLNDNDDEEEEKANEGKQEETGVIRKIPGWYLPR